MKEIKDPQGTLLSLMERLKLVEETTARLTKDSIELMLNRDFVASRLNELEAKPEILSEPEQAEIIRSAVIEGVTRAIKLKGL